MHNSAISTSISNQRYQSPSPTNSMDSFIPLLTIGCSNRPYVILRIFPSVLQKIPDRRMVVRVIPSRVNSILKIICINIHIIFRRTWRCSENYCSVFQNLELFFDIEGHLFLYKSYICFRKDRLNKIQNHNLTFYFGQKIHPGISTFFCRKTFQTDIIFKIQRKCK